MTKNPVMQAVERDVDFVPYTLKDRILQWVILGFVIVNLIAVIVGFIWGI